MNVFLLWKLEMNYRLIVLRSTRFSAPKFVSLLWSPPPTVSSSTSSHGVVVNHPKTKTINETRRCSGFFGAIFAHTVCCWIIYLRGLFLFFSTSITTSISNQCSLDAGRTLAVVLFLFFVVQFSVPRSGFPLHLLLIVFHYDCLFLKQRDVLKRVGICKNVVWLLAILRLDESEQTAMHTRQIYKNNSQN